MDLKAETFDSSANCMLDVRAEGGAFMKTEDGKYVAYIYVNSVDDATASAVIGIKRLTLN